jgi:phosphoglycolate phosphatase-like HAD superfamily hydrolase
VVDDMLAARASKKELRMLAIGFLRGRGQGETMKDSLVKAGADLVIQSPRELLRLTY